MLNIGMTELLIFSIIALLVLGPEKLPEAARFIGKWYVKLKRMVSNVQNDIDRELRISELREQMQNEMKRIQELESKMQIQMQELQQQSLHSNEAKVAPFEHRKKYLTYFYCSTNTQTIPFCPHSSQQNFSKNVLLKDISIEKDLPLKVAI